MECFGGIGELEGDTETNLTSDDLLQLLGQQAIKHSTEDGEHNAQKRRRSERPEFDANGMLIGGEVPQEDTSFSDKPIEHTLGTDNYHTEKDVDNGITGVTVPVIVKEEPLNDFNVMQAILGLNHSLAPADSSSISFEEEPRGRPRGPKHPVWTFFKLRRTHGPTNGYMCELCGGYFVGAANTTNAAKHLKCRHKTEYALYSEMHDSAKRGTFVGDLHAQLREIMIKGRARRLAGLGGIALPALTALKDEFEEPVKEKEECSMFEPEPSSPRFNPIASESVFSLSDLRKPVTPSTSTNVKGQSIGLSLLPPLYGETSLRGGAPTDESGQERNTKNARLETAPEPRNDSSQTIADQMQSFVQGFRRLESELYERIKSMGDVVGDHQRGDEVFTRLTFRRSRHHP